MEISIKCICSPEDSVTSTHKPAITGEPVLSIRISEDSTYGVAEIFMDSNNLKLFIDELTTDLIKLRERELDYVVREGKL